MERRSRGRVIGMPALLFATVAHGIFRGHQDTRTPLWVALGISGANLILDPILIFGLDWGLAGAAWATMLAQWIGAAVFAVLFARRRRQMALHWAWPSRQALGPLVGAGRALVIRSGALLAAFTLATAVASLGAAQAVVGRGQNQFNFAVSLAQTQLNNLAASESRIRDADLAAEAANLTKAQILQQAGIAALAQANVAPQAVLSLLRG